MLKRVTTHWWAITGRDTDSSQVLVNERELAIFWCHWNSALQLAKHYDLIPTLGKKEEEEEEEEEKKIVLCLIPPFSSLNGDTKKTMSRQNRLILFILEEALFLFTFNMVWKYHNMFLHHNTLHHCRRSMLLPWHKLRSGELPLFPVFPFCIYVETRD